MSLIWIGNTKGVEGLPGVPARDLTDGEATVYDRKYLLATGLYVEAKKASRKDAGTEADTSDTAGE